MENNGFDRLKKVFAGEVDPMFTGNEPLPLDMMLEDLIKLDDMVWGKYAFSRDPLRHKFTAIQIEELTRKANDCGREYAEKVSNEYRTTDPVQIAEKLGLEIEDPDRPSGISRITFAEYIEPNHINIYKDTFLKAKSFFEDERIHALLGENFDLRNLLIAHELFHHLEELNKKEIFTRTEKIDLWAIKPFKNRSPINCLGEIAGMQFAKTLLHLEYSPFVMDVFLVYGYGKEVSSNLYREIMKICMED